MTDVYSAGVSSVSAYLFPFFTPQPETRGDSKFDPRAPEHLSPPDLCIMERFSGIQKIL